MSARHDRPTPNALGSALGLLGDEWTLLILRAAFEGAHRYVDWKSALPVSDAVLSARLRTLVDAGVLRRTPAGSTRAHYGLTRRGAELWRLLLAIWDWELHHAEGQADRLPRMRHTGCGRDARPVVRCHRCGGVCAAHDVDARFGPSGGFERSVPVGANRRRTGHRPAGSGSATGPGMFPDTMAVIGSRWSAAVIGAAFLGAHRFRDFERVLGAPPAVIADRLRGFVAAGVLAVDETAGGYRLTPKGTALFGVVVALLDWAERWLPAPEGPAIVATHRPCGHALRPEWACDACGDELVAEQISIVAPAGGGPTGNTAPAGLVPPASSAASVGA